jgi:hypothetical protein
MKWLCLRHVSKRLKKPLPTIEDLDANILRIESELGVLQKDINTKTEEINKLVGGSRGSIKLTRKHRVNRRKPRNKTLRW